MSIDINDREVVLAILSAGVIDNPFTVRAYSKKVEQQLRNVLDP